MNDYVIYCDVSGDVDEEVIEAGKIRFIEMDYSIGDEMRVCGGVKPEDEVKAFYDAQRGNVLTKTSQVTPSTYVSVLGPCLKEGVSAMCICLSSGLSSTYQSACLAAEQLKDKYPDAEMIPVDSLAASGGLGILCERAAANREKGMSLKDNAADVQKLAHRLRHWFLVQDLEYLKRGGRVSAATALIGGLLNIKPILRINEQGALTTEFKERGYKAAARRILQLFADQYDASSQERVYVIHADAPDVAAHLLREAQQLFPQARFTTAMLSPIIGAHTGPNMAALVFVGKEG